jgi:hypothetical protein
MPLDCHLFNDAQEGAAKNVALTYHIGGESCWRIWPCTTALKYSFATPTKEYDALQQTIAAGCTSPNQIAQDVKRIFEET